jgi:SAM-dependent methyltransferase
VTVPGEANAARKRLARHVSGSGIEIGPGPHPFRLLPEGVDVRFVDRWGPEERRALVAELRVDEELTHPGGGTDYVEPDIVADFNTDRLGAVADGSQDFVIASHVLEHLAEPIGFIAEIHRVLRPGGVTLVLLPDRHRTEDRFRPPTALDHLVAEYGAGVSEVSDAHLIEFLKDRGKRVKRSPEARQRTLDTWRRQSIHVHCWDAQEFLGVLLWGIDRLGEQWELLDACLYEPPIHYEFGYVLRRSETEIEPALRSRQFEESWQTWRDAQIRSRPTAFAQARPHRLPAWVYQLARRQIRQHRAPAWLFKNANRLGSMSRRARAVVLRPLKKGAG